MMGQALLMVRPTALRMTRHRPALPKDSGQFLMILRVLCLVLIFVLSASASEWFPVKMESATYPPLACQAQLSGSVHLRVQLNVSGQVIHVEVVSGHPVLGRTAEANIKLWKFVVVRDASPPSSTIDFTSDFELQKDGEQPTAHFSYEHPFKVTITSGAHEWTP
jgi:TonB family protein